MDDVCNDVLIMDFTDDLASFSMCKKMKFGATIYKNGIIASGVNHPYSMEVCNPCLRELPDKVNYLTHPFDGPDGKIKSGTHLELCRAIHAEQSALMFALRQRIDITDGVMYVAGRFPDGTRFERDGFYCSFCSRLIHDSGLSGVKIRLEGGAIKFLSIEEIMKSSFERAAWNYMGR